MSHERIEEWKNRLLDLSLNNRKFLAFSKNEKGGAVRFLFDATEEAVTTFLSALLPKEESRNAEFLVKPRPENWEPEMWKPALERHSLHVSQAEGSTGEEGFRQRLSKLRSSAAKELEEKGSNTLYIAAGFLEFTDEEHKGETYLAPLLLVPVELRPKKVSGAVLFTLSPLAEGLRLNDTLLERLRRKGEVSPEELSVLRNGEERPDVERVFVFFNSLVRDKRKDWSLRYEACLGLFSFTKFVLWKDLDDSEKANALLKNAVVHHLVLESKKKFPPLQENFSPDKLDEVPTREIFCPRGADSSQLSAVLSSATGENLIIEGPPGTGKSQTIENIIFQCLAAGRSVLFVAEKRAALDVVHKRLCEDGLEDFCLELHSNKTNRGSIVEQFKQTLNTAKTAPTAEVSDWEKSNKKLEDSRKRLKDYFDALYGKRPCGFSLFDAMDKRLPRRGEVNKVKVHIQDILNVDEKELAALRELVEKLADRGKSCFPVSSNPLGVLDCRAWSSAWEREVFPVADSVNKNAEHLITAFQNVARMSGREVELPAGREIDDILSLINFLLPASGEKLPAGVNFCSIPREIFCAERDAIIQSVESLAQSRAHLARLGFDEEKLRNVDCEEMLKHWQTIEAEETGFKRRAIRRVRMWQVRCRLYRANKFAELPALQIYLNSITGFGKNIVKSFQRGFRDCGNGTGFAVRSLYGIAGALAQTGKGLFTGIRDFFSPPGMTDSSVPAILKSAGEVKSIKAKLAEKRAWCEGFFGKEVFAGDELVPAELLKTKAWGEELYKRMSRLTGESPGSLRCLETTLASFFSDQNKVVREWFVFFVNAEKNYRETFLRFSKMVSLRLRPDEAGEPAAPFATVAPLPGDCLALFKKLLPEMRVEGALGYWCRWRETRGVALERGLREFVREIEQAEGLFPEDLEGMFEHSFFMKFIEVALEENVEILKDWTEHERDVSNFSKWDDQCRKLAPAVVRARLFARIQQGGEKEGADVSVLEEKVLQNEIEKKAKHLPTRVLFSRIPRLLTRLKPCVLASPLSVAQYFVPSAEPLFDVVIFDEASQIPVWDAVGAIARGRQLIVAGDPKQLPPTTFFNANYETEDGDEPPELIDLESILSELQTAGMPNKRLRWHYRSRREGLIAFSNRTYYEGDLLTFPTPEIAPAGVSFRYVTGACYDGGNGRTRTNRKEAEALVDELFTRLADKEGAQYSYGIVTFNVQQQHLIDSLIASRLDKEETGAAARYFAKAEESGQSVFVKNLENVQGDERDVIFFSICYGPDENGDIGMNFGPLGHSGGERRLNVAVTRAKYEMVVFSSMKAEEIKLNPGSGAGVKDFQKFLEYAQKGSSVLATGPVGESAPENVTHFERTVKEELEKQGCEVVPRVGYSGYRVDLGVKDAQSPERFSVGVECCGGSYRNMKTVRDREKLCREILEGLDWKTQTVWPVDWWRSEKSREQFLKRIYNKP